MTRLPRAWPRFSVLLVLLMLVGLPGCRRPTAAAQSVVLNVTPPPPQQALEKALQDAIAEREDAVMGFVVYQVRIDRVVYDPSGNLAVLWLAMVDRQTGEVLESEPGLAIAQRASATEPWKISMQVDSDWIATLEMVPDTLLSVDQRPAFAPPPVQAVVQTFSGYYLPWAYGTSRRLTQSIGHKYIYGNCPTCLYSFDFADGTMFPLLAAKGGVVKYVSWSCPNNDHNCNNYLVLEDSSTSPVSYQLYLHLAYNSIPPALRQVGTPVQQGQFIGNVDNTGASTGHHLHFHVHTTPGSWFGTSQDITFLDVDINGGRPRMCVETQLSPSLPGWYPDCHPGGDWFTSGNVGANPPSAGLVIPANGSSITQQTVTLGGTATDNVGIARVEILANWQGSWQTVAPIVYNPAQSSVTFVASVDLCALGIANGPVDFAVRAWDVEGNVTPGLPGVRSVAKNFACPQQVQTTCEPGPNEVALFADPGYQGACEVFDATTNNGSGAGWYTSSNLGLVGNNNAASLKVGSNVRAIVYDNSNFTGRPAAFESNQANFEDDRLGGNDRLSALIVQPRSTAPDAPVIDSPRNGTELAPTAADSLVAAWWRGSAVDYRATLSGPVSKSTPGWIVANNWSLGSLPPGNYTLTVQARNSGGTSQASLNFSVAAGSLPGNTVSAPYTANFEDGAPGWLASGLWRQAQTTDYVPPLGSAVLNLDDDVEFDRKSVEQQGQLAPGFGELQALNRYFASNNGVDYASSQIWGSDLTSPPIALPAGSRWYLRFDTYTHTESSYPIWDRRLVQISINGGPFEDFYPLWDEPQQFWGSSPALDLSPYAGQTVRIRFHFDTIDSYYNSYAGWWIDNFRITNEAPPSDCVDPIPNDAVTEAQPLPLNQPVSGQICPAGDVDFFRFDGTAGQQVAFDVDAQSLGSALDPYLYLYDASGGLIVGQDDEVPYEQIDPRLGYTLPQDGSYYLKIKAWNHPGAGGSNFFYTLRAVQDVQPPQVVISTPNGNAIPAGAFTLTASAFDEGGSGLARVDFYVHRPNWEVNQWLFLGSDSDGSDGYRWTIDPAQLGSLVGGALYVRAVDGAGNSWGDLRVGLQIGSDSTPPQVAWQPVSNPLPSSAILLQWSGSDAESGLDHYELAYQLAGASWQTWGSLSAETTQAWFLGAPATIYNVQLTGVDRAGNRASVTQTLVFDAACAPDAFEDGDDLPGSAPLGGLEWSEHTLCPAQDDDWLRVIVTRDGLSAQAEPLGGGAAVILEFYDASGQVLLARQVAGGLQQPTSLALPLPPGEYRLRIRPLYPTLAGSAARVRVRVIDGLLLFLPAVLR
jgi:murein DD-endopeptidase MepM/ murein hydrolase activator NlpD